MPDVLTSLELYQARLAAVLFCVSMYVTRAATDATEILPVAVEIASGVDAVTAGVPLAVPAVHVGVPAVACVVTVNAPEVPPSKIRLPCVVEACPRVNTPELIFAFALPETTAPVAP